MIRKFYDPKVAPGNAVEFGPDATWQGSFDLSSIFNVPAAGQYVVSFTSTLTGLDGSSRPARISVTSTPATIILPASKSAATSKVKRDAISGCDAGQTWVIRTALKSAVKLAADAHDNTPVGPTDLGVAPWYSQFFNDQSWQTVREAFGGVSQYNIDGKGGVTRACVADSDPGCASGAFGFAPVPGTVPGSVSLCSNFFDSTWASTACGVPGTQTPTLGTVSQWQQPYDQPGVILHELLHDEGVTGTPNINDGPGFPEGQDQYTYDDTIALATNAATNGDAPLQNSNNFLYYAMTIRNHLDPSAACDGCHLIPPQDVCSQAPQSELAFPAERMFYASFPLKDAGFRSVFRSFVALRNLEAKVQQKCRNQ